MSIKKTARAAAGGAPVPGERQEKFLANTPDFRYDFP
jgi:hypothetical protein